jgi:hypothetical protein
MKHKILILLSTVLLLAVARFVIAQGTAFTYQGRLATNGSPANGAYDLQFSLYNAATSGTLIGGPLSLGDVPVTNGLFTVLLDFGAPVFAGQPVWLQIGVRPGASTGAYTNLSPLQPVTPAPSALYSATAGNVASGPGQAIEFKVNNVRALRLEPTTDSPNLIGGLSGNYVSPGVVGAVIAGGGGIFVDNGLTYVNSVSDNFGTVGGGLGNNQSGYASVIGGGFINAIESGVNFCTIGGGCNNRIQSGSFFATIPGGRDNTIQGANNYSTIGGGEANTISANLFDTTIGGGRLNLILTNAHYATIPGGYRAQAASFGEMAYASGRFTTNGDAQMSAYVLRQTTADATPTELFLDGATATQRMIVPKGGKWAFDILVIASSSTGATAGYQIKGVIKNVASTTTLVGGLAVITNLPFDAGAATWTVTAQADNADGALAIKVTGAAATTIRWVATVRATELIF